MAHISEMNSSDGTYVRKYRQSYSLWVIGLGAGMSFILPSDRIKFSIPYGKKRRVGDFAEPREDQHSRV